MLRVLRYWWGLIRLTFQLRLIYGLDFFLEVIGIFVTFLVMTFFWQFLYTGRAQIGDFTRPEMITYLVGGAFLASIIFFVAQGDQINRVIKDGQLNSFLVQPINIPFTWIVRDLARRIQNALMVLPAFVLTGWLFRHDLVPPASSQSLSLALLAFLGGVFIHFFLYGWFALWAFWADETWGPRFLLNVLMETASGRLVPLSLLPAAAGSIFQFLPFTAMLYLPLQLYLGKITSGAATQAFTIEAGWLIIVMTLFFVTYTQGIKKYTAVGG